MTDGFLGAESALSLSQSKTEHVRYSYSYGFLVVTQLCGKGCAICVLNAMDSALDSRLILMPTSVF